MPKPDQEARFLLAMAEFGDEALPGLEFYWAAEDQQVAAGRLTLVSTQILLKFPATVKVRSLVPVMAAFRLGYAAGLSAEAAGTAPALSRNELPPLEFGIAGPKPSSVLEHSRDILLYCTGLASKIVELLPVPAPVWLGFERAVIIRLAVNFGRAGKKVAPAARMLVMGGYLARLVDQAYGLTPTPLDPQQWADLVSMLSLQARPPAVDAGSPAPPAL